jgi:hypothetical protein
LSRFGSLRPSLISVAHAPLRLFPSSHLHRRYSRSYRLRISYIAHIAHYARIEIFALWHLRAGVSADIEAFSLQLAIRNKFPSVCSIGKITLWRRTATHACPASEKAIDLLTLCPAVIDVCTFHYTWFSSFKFQAHAFHSRSLMLNMPIFFILPKAFFICVIIYLPLRIIEAVLLSLIRYQLIWHDSSDALLTSAYSMLMMRAHRLIASSFVWCHHWL